MLEFASQTTDFPTDLFDETKITFGHQNSNPRFNNHDMRILILCTGNSCRSQMAEGFFRTLLPTAVVFSAGTHPASRVQPLAIAVMKELGIDISGHSPKSIERFLDHSFDLVITVCDNAKEHCPVFSGTVGRRVHMGFDDPTFATGTPEHVISEFRRVRDMMKRRFTEFVEKELM